MIAGPELVILLVLAFPVLTIWALIDMIRRPRESFEAAGRSLVVWAVLVVLVPVVAPVLYLSIIRRELARSTPVVRVDFASV